MLRCLGSWFSVGILIFVASSVDSRAAAKPNIVLITLDSTRADRMGFLGARSGLTPSLDRIAHHGIVFTQSYAQEPLSVASNATILTGTYPQTHHASELGVPLAATLPYLPDLLHAAGYRTAAFVGSILLDFRNGPFQNYDRGFDVYDAGFHQSQRGESRFQSVERRGGQAVARATKWLVGNKQRPFFLWVQLQDPQGAYGASYDRAVAAADAAVGNLVNFLRTQSLYEDALIVIASSQGESLGAHGEDTHGIFLYDETTHVPLVLKLPKDQMAGKQVKNRARLLDIAPTVLAEAGIPVPAQMQGQSLMRIAQASSQADQPAYSRSELPQQGFGCSVLESWRAGKYLYIRAPKPELYDLSVDPNAIHNLAQSAKATLETMASQLQALDSHIGNEPGKSIGSGLTSSEMQKLASLGYVGLQKSGAGVNAATEGSDPKDVIAAVNKTLGALLELDDGRPEKAIPALRQVIAAQPSAYLAQYAMGTALTQQQQYAEAIGYLHKAIELQPDSAWAHYEMGLSLMKTGDFKTSAVHLEIASGRLPGFSALHSMLAEVYEHLGRSPEAAHERNKASQKE
ncbi:MAG TPA: sulfatase-like hydrolase/transferase [Terriglobales bacterium]|jgi:choline-sulfatase